MENKMVEEFAKRYKELCDEMGCRINVTPTYMARDDGTFSLVLNWVVVQVEVKQ